MKFTFRRKANIKPLYKHENRVSVFYKAGLNFSANLISYVYLIGISFVILYPVLYMLSMAFRPSAQVNDLNVIWIPTKFTLANIINVWDKLKYASLLWNSFVFSIVSAFLSVISSCIIGYGMARFEFKGKNILLVFLALTLILPSQIVAIPNFLMFSDFNPLGIVSLLEKILNLNIRINLFDNPINTYLLAATGVGLKGGLYILIFMQFFRGLPVEIEEAAYVDGCGFFGTMRKVMLPNAIPALVVVMLFSLVWYWNDTSFVSLYFDQFKTVSSELLHISKDAATLLSATEATDVITWVQSGVFLSITPLIILYLLMQKKFIESVASTGLVG